MLIVQLNRNSNQKMMVSRINERNKRKIGLQVRLGKDPPTPRRSNPRQGIAEIGKFGASGSPR